MKEILTFGEMYKEFYKYRDIKSDIGLDRSPIASLIYKLLIELNGWFCHPILFKESLKEKESYVRALAKMSIELFQGFEMIIFIPQDAKKHALLSERRDSEVEKTFKKLNRENYCLNQISIFEMYYTELVKLKSEWNNFIVKRDIVNQHHW